MQNVSVNHEQKLFVLKNEKFVTCYGFENCFQDSKQLAEILKRDDLIPVESEIGTLEQYQLYLKLIDIIKKGDIKIGTWFEPGTSSGVKYTLESARISGEKLRLFFGDTITGKCSMQEVDVYGRIGRSTGYLKVPLLIEGTSSYGGAISTSSVIKIVSSKKRTLYEHANFHLPRIEIVEANVYEDYPIEVHCDNQLHARFKNLIKAQKWVSFMKGESLRT